MASAPTKIKLLDAQTIAKIGNLELLSTNVVDGFLSGKHRSTQRGGCFEFSEHRGYTPGDEMRLIDWRVYGKSDRYYVKQFEEETNLQAIMVVDASGSMEFGLSTATKLDYARMASACLSRLMLRQRDAVGLATIDRNRGHYIPPRSRASHLRAIMDELRRVRPGGNVSLTSKLREVAKRIKRRGLIVIFSDCFGEVEPLSQALHNLRLRGHEVIVFHTTAPEELSFSFSRWSRFECLEVNDVRIDVDPAAVRRRYLERVREFVEALKYNCAKTGCDYVPLTTDRPLGDALAHYLTRRTARQHR